MCVAEKTLTKICLSLSIFFLWLPPTHSNNVDVIIFSLFENQYNQCSDTPMGTYYVPVQYYLQGTIQQKMQDMEDQGYEYEQPEVMQYAYCTGMEYQGQYYYLQVGCADDPTQGLAINIYEDKECTVRSSVEGYGDDANIDVSDIQIKLKKCRACVMWFDRDDDGNVDDGFYENRKQNAPLCSTTWTYKEECNKKCQRTGLERSRDSWSASDQILLAILTTFGLIMLGLIINKRQKMTNKETLLEQAAMSAAGLQQPHVIGIFVLVVLVIAVFALLGLKNITWFLLLLINTVLFAYLMKLTVSTVGGETLIGPDGQIIRQDSDDSSAASQEENHNNGTYVLPTIT